MSTQTLAVLIVLGFALSIILGNFLKMHIGVLAFCFAMIIAAISGQVNLSGVVGLWPTNTFFLLLGITLFYGYAIENGTLNMMSTHMMYACRKVGWFIPFMIWIAGFVLSATGSGSLASAAVLAPLAASIAAEAGIHYFPVLVAVYTSTIAGGNSLIAQQGSTMRGYIEEWGESLADKAVGIIGYLWASDTLACLLFFIPFYFIFKCYKTKAVEGMEKPASPTSEQTKTMIMIIISIVILIVPPSLANITGNATLKAVSGWCDIKSVSLICAAVCAFLRLADEKKVITQRVPWNTLLMVSGVGTLIGLASKVGVVDLFAEWISTSVPQSLIAPAFALAGGILSLFSGALSVVCPLFFPMVPALAASTGLNPALLYTSIYAGASSTGVSPLSTGGAMILANVVAATGDKENVQDEGTMFRNQFIIALLFMAFTMLLCWLKVFDIFGRFDV